MGKPTTKTELLIQIRREINKWHTEFDGFNRPSKTYIAPVYAVQDTPCFVMEYLYYPSTNIVKGRKEGYTVWQSSFEDPDFLVDDLSNLLTDDLGNYLLGD